LCNPFRSLARHEPRLTGSARNPVSCWRSRVGQVHAWSNPETGPIGGLSSDAQLLNQQLSSSILRIRNSNSDYGYTLGPQEYLAVGKKRLLVEYDAEAPRLGARPKLSGRPGTARMQARRSAGGRT